MRNTSKQRIVIAVVTLQIVRLFYFSSGFLNTILEKKGKTSEQTRCAIEWSANLPVALEYVNVFIVHEFLLRVYLVLTSQVDKYRSLLVCYIAVILIGIFGFFVALSSVYCA